MTVSPQSWTSKPLITRHWQAKENAKQKYCLGLQLNESFDAEKPSIWKTKSFRGDSQGSFPTKGLNYKVQFPALRGFLPCRAVWYLSGIWNEHSLPLENSIPWNISGQHSTTDGPKCPCPIFPLTPINRGFLPFMLHWIYYVMGWLDCLRNTLVFLPDLHTYPAL